ncbi:VanW family protein [Peribacillus loiseleuriae]|uniref:VanW family protein n=1 Tax=Peribacillus loiseleuriae TaxID=1679170 RepID=UPI0006708EE5|nr:VanW family protein [Peribacillus loiseleuriae]
MEKRSPSYLRILTIVILSTAFIMSCSQLGAFAYGKISQTDQPFAANTSIGTVLVSGESKKQATENLLHSINERQTKSGLSLTFADRKMTLPVHAIQFSLEESVRDAKNGIDNPLVATITESNVRQLLKEIADEKLIETVKVSELRAEIQKQAGLLDMNEQVISLTDFFDDSVSVSVIAHAKKENIDVKSLSSWVESTPPIKIPAFGEFSFMNDLSVNAGNWSDEFLTQAASLVYEAGLSTNLQILERNTSKELPEGVKLGFEAKVNRNGMDLKLANPNDFEMTIAFKVTQPDVLIVEISGYPTGRQYNVVVKDSKTIPYRKIVQYTALLPNGKDIKVKGKPGYSVSVYRETQDPLKKKLESVQMSNDFYLPVNEVVLREMPVESETEIEEGARLDGEVNEQQAVEKDEIILRPEISGEKDNSLE